MTVFQAVVLGVLQGLAEFLPISSSAHLALAPWLFGWPDPGLSFDVALHVGTLAAVLWFFRREWIRLAAAAWRIVLQRGARTAEEWRVIYLIIATIPGGIGGLVLNKYAESAFRSPALIAGTLTVMGILLWAIDRITPATRPLDSVRWTDALLVGIAQVFALIPGVSRSGSTITAGRALRLDRQSAAVFSFLMSMPITAAAALLEVPKAIHAGGFGLPLAVGVLASAISGWLAIGVLLRYVSRNNYAVFAIYRIILAAAVLFVYFRRG
ncbi:MAG TPA: undecaprenyl-diphosphatase UppP [Gemmatimonadaceae bacterium]|nr:undecaprenyl-diphosphatase UppP [Gemmatimonadaceae bacterium]